MTTGTRRHTADTTGVRPYLVAVAAIVFAAGTLIVAAPRANAGCQQVLPTQQVCDGPVQPDGSWQRCEVKLYDISDRLCMTMGGNTAALPYGPPGHIDP
jgi:hypothetical protein